MNLDLPDCDTRDISKALVRLRGESGAITLGRVMTLVIIASAGNAEEALDAATYASRRHPCRILTLVRRGGRGAARMDAQVRIGDDAGLSEVVVMQLRGELADHGEAVVTPLLLPDSPVVAWWPGDPGADVAESPIGAMAHRRITDASLSRSPRQSLQQRRATYADGDTDMAWARTTRWRGLLTTALDQPPYEPVRRAVVKGASDSASTDLLAGWLAVRLRCPVRRVRGPRGVGLISVSMERASGPIELVRPDRRFATVTQPGQPQRRVDLSRPGMADSLAEELRSMEPDPIYREALLKGLPLVEGVSTPSDTRARATR